MAGTPGSFTECWPPGYTFMWHDAFNSATPLTDNYISGWAQPIVGLSPDVTALFEEVTLVQSAPIIHVPGNGLQVLTPSVGVGNTQCVTNSSSHYQWLVKTDLNDTLSRCGACGAKFKFSADDFLLRPPLSIVRPGLSGDEPFEGFNIFSIAQGGGIYTFVDISPDVCPFVGPFFSVLLDTAGRLFVLGFSHRSESTVVIGGKTYDAEPSVESVIASSAYGIISPGVWYEIETKWILSTVTDSGILSDGSVEVRVNGTVVALSQNIVLQNQLFQDVVQNHNVGDPPSSYTHYQTRQEVIDQNYPNGTTWNEVWLGCPSFVDCFYVAQECLYGTPSVPVLPPVPVHPPKPPVDGVPRPCTPQTQVGNGGSGASGCNTGGVGGVRLYDGPFGTVPEHDDPSDGESLANARGIDLWVEIVHTDYPTGDTVTHRRAMVELADPATYEGGRKQGGLLGVGDIEHGLGNEQGGFEAATVDISYADSADRLFRNLLADQELEGDEVRIKITTIEGRLAGVPPRVIARAVAQKPRLQSSLEASFSASDYLFSGFGPFGPGRQFPSPLIPQSIFPYATADSTALALPVLYGEYSDEGATDPLTNVVNPKGLVPLIYVGPQAITTTTQSGGFPPYDVQLVPPPASAVTTIAQPIGSLTFHASTDHNSLTRYDVTLYAAGTTDPVIDVLSLGLPTPNANDDITVDLLTWLNSQLPGNYALTITAVSDEGITESSVSNSFSIPVVAETSVGFGWAGPVNTDPYFAIMAVFAGQGSRLVLKSGVVHTTAPHNFRVTWTEAPQAAEYWVFMYTAGSAWDAYVNPQAVATVRYKRLSATPTNSHDPAWNYFVDFTSPTDGSSWPPAASTTTTTTDDWDTYLLCGHAIFDILAVYASDLAAGGTVYESQRIQIDPETRGDILCPFYSTWPFPTSYRDFEDADGTVYRMTVIYARGPLSDAHKNGTVNMAVNPIGIEDVGDGSGLPIVDAHAVQQHWIENFLLRDYRSGLWSDAADYPQWEDGTPMVRSSSFADRQGFTQSSIGGRGLTVRWYASNQRVLQDWFREWNQSTDSRMGINSHGQIVVSGLDEFVDTSNWPRILHDTDLFGDVVIVSGEERENSVSGVCDWDPDKKQFRGKTIPYESQAAITKYKVRRKTGNKIESTILYDEQQLRWVLQRRLRRLREGARTVEITGKVDLLDYDVGSGLLLNTIDGVGPAGYVDQPMFILRRRFKVSERLVTLTLLDIGDFVIPSESQFVIVSEGSPASGNPVLATGGLLVTV